MPGVEDKIEWEYDDMDQDFPESDKSESSFSESAASGSEEEESELDEDEADRIREEYMEKLVDLEQQFITLKEYLFHAKSSQVVQKLDEVKQGTAKEYIEPVSRLQDSFEIKMHIADVRLELRKKNLANQSDGEKQAANQNLECEKKMLYEALKQELEDKIQRLKQDHHNTNINDVESQTVKRKVGSVATDRRRKPVTVTGPYIVYMLKESHILEDYAAVKMALKQRLDLSPPANDNSSHHVRFEDGRLNFEGVFFSKSNRIFYQSKQDQPIFGTINSITSTDVQVRREDGSLSKLLLSQLRSGKYKLQHLS